MRVEVKASLILAVLVTVLSVVVQVSGLNKSFITGQMAFLIGAIVLNVGVVFWALRQTAATRSYGKQLVSSGMIGLVGGILVVVTSWLLLSYVFPNALAEMREAAIEYMKATNVPEPQYQEQLAQVDAATPMSQAIAGGVGTFFTSLITGALIAIFQRKK